MWGIVNSFLCTCLLKKYLSLFPLGKEYLGVALFSRYVLRNIFFYYAGDFLRYSLHAI